MRSPPVRELELDLDAFEGPFDLLLTLLLKEALEPREVDVAGIVLAFVDRLEDRDEVDLEACGEFLVLVAALLELKARELFPDEASELEGLEPEEAAEELARRLAEYRRMKEAAAWLVERLAGERDRWFRLGPAPLAPQGEPRFPPQDPSALADALRSLAASPPNVSLGHMALRFPPVSLFVERFRAILARRRRFDFDTEVAGLSRVEQAVAFLALLELRKSGEIALSQAAPFAPIHISRASRSWAATAPAGPSPAPTSPDVAGGPMPSGAVQSTVPSGLDPPATPQEREEGLHPTDGERITTWTVRSA
jgi:segregation and condensation protein A